MDQTCLYIGKCALWEDCLLFWNQKKVFIEKKAVFDIPASTGAKKSKVKKPNPMNLNTLFNTLAKPQVSAA